MQKRWRVIKDMEGEGKKQMSVDESIATLRGRGEVGNTLRFYRWKPPCVSLGYFQDVVKEVDLEKIEEKGYDFVRRYTGGGCVFHKDELTYSIVVGEDEVPYDIVESYRFICEGIVKGLKRLGFNAEFREVNDVTVDGKKVSGNAQTRMNGVVLQHGTILLDVDVEEMFSFLKVGDEKKKDKMIKSVKESVLGLGKDFGVVREVLLKSFGDVFGVNFYEDDLSEEEKRLSEELYRNKYNTKEWNYGDRLQG